MIGIKATVKLHGLEAALRRLNTMEKKAAFREVGAHARQDQALHDAKHEGPDGPWPALHPSTVARYAKMAKAKRGKARARKLLGRLPRALKTVITGSSIRIVSRVKWAFVHQAGGRAGRGARIPRRQFLWISDRLMQRSSRVFQQHLLKAWKGR